MSATTLGMTMTEPENFLMPRKYKIRYQCDLCGHQYSRTYKAIPIKDPPCPSKACVAKQQLIAAQREMENLRRMVAEGVAPAQTGANTRVKAVDETAKIVMEDYKMTDLKDNIRHGENVAPKLPPQQQTLADNYFNGKGLRAAGFSAKQAEALGRRAIAGAFRNQAVAPNAILPSEVRNGNSPLRTVGIETINNKPR
jgi:hypothetical protein